MQRDEAMLSHATSFSQTVARLYQWDDAWVSLGRNQTPQAVLRHPDKTPWVRRPTGGGAVLHGHDLTISIATPLALLQVKHTNIRCVHYAILSPLIEALNALGIPASFGQAPPRQSAPTIAGDCFLTASKNDIINASTGQKIVGCALRITSHAVLAQCSIPVDEPLVPPEEIFYQAHSPIPLGIPINQLREALTNSIKKWGIGETSPMPPGGMPLGG